MQCDCCGKTEANNLAMYRHRGIYVSSKTLCQQCLVSKIDRQTMRRLFVFGIVGIAAFLAGQGLKSHSWFLFNCFLLCAFYSIGFIIHEFGHAIGAYLTNQKIKTLTIGRGKKLFQFYCGETEINIHLIPIEGHSQFIPQGERWLLSRVWITILMGPLSNLILATGVSIFVLQFAIVEHFIRTPAPLTCFVLANIVLALVNLIPLDVHTASGKYRSDGGILLDILRNRSLYKN